MARAIHRGMTTPAQARGLTPREFFARRLPGASMQDAHRATGIAYSTVHKLVNGASASQSTLVLLARWSRRNPSAAAAGVFISLDALVDAAQAHASEAA